MNANRLLIDTTHTSHTTARTGIQQVVLALLRELGGFPITRDPFLSTWRRLAFWEQARLAATRPPPGRWVPWPFSVRMRHRLLRALGRSAARTVVGEFEGLIEPELFSPDVARDLPRLWPRVHGPRVAIFYDAIALQLPEFSPADTVARFPAYLHELLRFDGIAAISADSRDSLLSYWRWLGVSDAPPIVAIPLGITPKAASRSAAESNAGTPVVLSVGTLEGRKNHLALLDACERLWTEGRQFRLRLIGHANPTGATALERLRALQAAGRPLEYDGPATDNAIEAAYAACALTVYPSLAEGFGLPVIESLARGKPCVCSGRGALGEISRGGGCVPLEHVDAPALATAIAGLLDSPAARAQLATAAAGRRFKSWQDYARELVAWMRTLSCR